MFSSSHPLFVSTSVFYTSTKAADYLGKFKYDSSIFHFTDKQVSSWFSQHVSASFSHQCAREQNKGDPSRASVGSECYFYLANMAALLLDGSFLVFKRNVKTVRGKQRDERSGRSLHVFRPSLVVKLVTAQSRRRDALGAASPPIRRLFPPSSLHACVTSVSLPTFLACLLYCSLRLAANTMTSSREALLGGGL